MWLNLGIKEEDMKKPKIAIINSSSNIAVCFSHLDAIAKFAADEIYKAGGISFEIRTAAPADFIFTGHNGGFVQASRDLIANDIEAVSYTHLDVYKRQPLYRGAFRVCA